MKRRRGLSLLELIITGVILMMLLGVCAQVLSVTSAQHRATRQREAAAREAANVMERLTARTWEELTPEAAANLPLSSEAQAALPQGRLKVEVDRAPGEPAAKRITVVVSWPDRSGQSDLCVRLVAWKYRQGGAAPVVESPESPNGKTTAELP